MNNTDLETVQTSENIVSEVYLDNCFNDELGRNVMRAFHRLNSYLITELIQDDSEGVDVTSVIDESLTAYHHRKQQVRLNYFCVDFS